MRRGLAGLLGALVLTSVAIPPAEAGPATDQVRTAVESVIRILQNAELKSPDRAKERRARLREIARSFFDFEEMSRRCLGRHWSTATPAQRERFTQLFTDLLEDTYVGRIESYSGEKFEYLQEQVDGPITVVRTRVTTKEGAEVPVDYRMLQNSSHYGAYDVQIEGVSLVANYRSQFNRIISQSSMDELLRRLEQKQGLPGPPAGGTRKP
jgi:phospholipid transport system substrate-binding protein